MNSNLFEMLPTNYSLTNHIYLIYVYKEDLALNNLQGLICHKTKPNQKKLKESSLCVAMSMKFRTNETSLLIFAKGLVFRFKIQSLDKIFNLILLQKSGKSCFNIQLYFVYMYVCMYVCTNPSARVGCHTRSFFKWSLNTEFSFFPRHLVKFKESNLPNYLPISKERIVGSISFQSVLILHKM